MKVNDEAYRGLGPSWLRLGFTVAESEGTRRLWFGLSFWQLVASFSVGILKRKER